MNHTDTMLWGGGFMWIFWLLLLLCIVMMIKILSGSSSSQENTNKVEDEAIKELRNRYASGEIEKDEFKRRKHELDKT